MTLNDLLSKFDNYILRLLPGRHARATRLHVLRRLGANIADGVFLGQGVRVMGPSKLTLETGVVVARDTVLDARGGLTLLESALIGFESILLTHTHNSSVPGVSIQSQGMYQKPVVIGSRSWLGTRVVVLPGVTLGDDVIVGSGSVVTKNLAPCATYAGTPARLLGQRKHQSAASVQ
jgi:acetyltransferase-like isoleucine patch superfamily enzyme